MRLQDFYFDLPQELIARYPLAERSASRLLSLNRTQKTIEHRQFLDILELVRPGDLFIFNNSRVIPARLTGHKATGGQIELLVERILDDEHVLAHVRASKAPKPGTVLWLADEHMTMQVIEQPSNLFKLRLLNSRNRVLDMLYTYGHIPIPPYLHREDEEIDKTRYQTVYAQTPGSVAAPTAGLHFDEAVLKQLQNKGVKFGYLTLHVGAGTFQPVRCDNIHEHKIHPEYLEVSQALCDQITETKAAGNRIIAVGTTSVRSLETAWHSNSIQPYSGNTQLFITPGYSFKSIDVLITNFHLPESTLLMLVSAFAGYEFTMAAYKEAVKECYRFFSYGDAMWVE